MFSHRPYELKGREAVLKRQDRAQEQTVKINLCRYEKVFIFIIDINCYSITADATRSLVKVCSTWNRIICIYPELRVPRFPLFFQLKEWVIQQIELCQKKEIYSYY